VSALAGTVAGWLAAILLLVPTSGARAESPNPAEVPIPILAYYYVWFQESSWDRAKIDYPLLGRYSSDDEEVMRRHVRWAKDAGIDGFIVSWKSTLPLDRRLEQLITIASEESFKLAIIYQGLDFQRDPQPIARVAADLDHFLHTYGGEPVFDIFGGPLVIWSGTWEYSPEEVGLVTESRRRSSCEWRSDLSPRCMLLLATERNEDGVRRLAGLVDGNAYYWSSVNPATFPGYEEKLVAMRDAVKETGGLWIAPAAPGFDARQIGGTTVVDRADGQTLRTQMAAAYASSPDAIGLISWNEFSENSHVEPSEMYGRRALEVLADIASGRPPEIPDLDSSEPNPGIISRIQNEMLSRALALGLVIALLIASGVAISRRRGAVIGTPRPGPNPLQRRGRE
jgi:Glycosyl hydrolase family 99